MPRMYDGGPAFSRPGHYTDKHELSLDDMREADAFDSEPSPGMSLRDWFAGQVVAGYLAAFAGTEISIPRPMNVAEYAYELADAMLVHRTQLGTCPFGLRDPRFGAHAVCANHHHSSPTIDPQEEGQ